MGSVRLGVGTAWLLDGRPFRVVRQLAAQRFLARDLTFQLDKSFSEQEILTLYTDGRLRLASTDRPEESVDPDGHAPAPRVVGDLSARDRRQLHKRWKAIEPLTRLSRPPVAADYRQRAAELKRRGQTCSVRSLRRYFAAWSRGGRDRMALLPATSRRGGRGGRRRHGLLARYPVVRQLVEQAIPLPRPSTLTRALSRRIAQLDRWEVDRARWGRRIADRRHKPTRRQQLARRILERVEIDHSPLKVVVGTEAGPIGQPWLTVLIDYYSRMIIGFCLGFEPPSYAVIMEALRHAILPKTSLAETYPRIRGEWPCFGLPAKLVCDRGADLTSNDLEQAAFQLGIELDFNPPRTPHFKGTVESFFDLLNDQLLSALPGRTFRSWEKRADANPDAGPLMPYEALREIVHLFLVDVYAAGKHPTADKTRLEMWQQSAAEFPPALPATPEELVVVLARRAERTLSNRGIELNGMLYLCDELMAMRAELAAQNLAGNRLQVRYNPWDLGAVWVLNPITGGYLVAPAIDPALRGMTAYQWRILKRAVRERFEAPEHLLSLSAGRNAIHDVVDAELQTPSRRRRSRAARFHQTLPRDNPTLPEADWQEVPSAETGDDADHVESAGTGDRSGDAEFPPSVAGPLSSLT